VRILNSKDSMMAIEKSRLMELRPRKDACTLYPTGRKERRNSWGVPIHSSVKRFINGPSIGQWTPLVIKSEQVTARRGSRSGRIGYMIHR